MGAHCRQCISSVEDDDPPRGRKRLCSEINFYVQLLHKYIRWRRDDGLGGLLIGVSIYKAEQDSVESNHKRTPIKLCMLCNSLLIC